jgi:mannose-6-phosphate isomerase
MDLYPIRLAPEFKERIWGTRDLSPIYGEVPGTEPIGEAWLTGDECKVANGPLAGTTLGDLTHRFGRALVGEAAPEPSRFPLLVKFLFPQEKLSVQVHPDDDAAKRVGEPCGKTECWYVLDAKPGAKIGLGLKPGVSKSDFEQAIRDVRAEELLNWIEVKPGEMYYVEAGTVHAIGPGSVLVETQQNSDTTYRLYDYGRPRELHIEKGMAALKEKTAAGKVKPGKPNAERQELLTSPCFQVEGITLREGRSTSFAQKEGTAQILVATNGSGVIESSGKSPIAFGKGDAVVIPASIKEWSIKGQWTVDVLRAMVPRLKTCKSEMEL